MVEFCTFTFCAFLHLIHCSIPHWDYDSWFVSWHFVLIYCYDSRFVPFYFVLIHDYSSMLVLWCAVLTDNALFFLIFIFGRRKGAYLLFMWIVSVLSSPPFHWCRDHHYHHHLSVNGKGRWSTTDDFISFLHFSLFSTALWDFANSRPVHSLMFSSHLFLCLPCLLSPFTVPCEMVLARLDNGRHDHTTAVCVSLWWSGLCVVGLPAGSWHGLPHW